MTEYSKRNVNGDAGEHLVAFIVTRELGWPCRLLDVDLGVDAEMELLDDANQSTGDIVKVQIKSFESLKAETKGIYADERHVTYWQRFSTPVIICCVDLSTRTVYWKEISVNDAYQSGGVAKRIDFDLAADRLDVSAKSKILALVSPPEMKEIADDLTAIRRFLESSVDAARICFDFGSIAALEDGCNSMQQYIQRIEAISLAFPWRLSAVDRGFLVQARRDIVRIRSDCSIERAGLIES